VVGSGVAKPASFELPDGTIVDILYEDRGVLAIDKPADRSARQAA
jgi:23S rRNA-/tRNA-specific pseudouridylate synthase